MPGPLHGYRIVDLTSNVAGPLGTMILGDQGADVIKVEAPDGGDATRAGGNRRAGFTASFLNNNRNKRSVVLDLKTAGGLQALMRLIAGADVFVQNFRSATPGRKFWTNTSAPAISRIKACSPPAVFRSSTTERLLRLLFRKDAVKPARRLPPARVASPPSGASTLITSAPWSPRIIVPSGPATFEVRSTMRYPCRGPGMFHPLKRK